MIDLRSTSYHGVMLRAVKASDEERLYRIFAESHADLMATTADRDTTQIDTLMQIQFQARQEQYRSNYPGARFDAIIEDADVIGNIYVAPVRDELRLVDVSLLSGFRNLGIGFALIKALLDEATLANKRVSLHVQRDNPAARLYKRLGFIDVSEEGIYKRMEWLPP
jgi:ribosomal protein S18 acetylase RimI-like enzyme